MGIRKAKQGLCFFFVISWNILAGRKAITAGEILEVFRTAVYAEKMKQGMLCWESEVMKIVNTCVHNRNGLHFMCCDMRREYAGY